MPLVIQAIERYGWANAFESCSFMPRLVQSDDTIRWLIEQIQHGLKPIHDEKSDPFVACRWALKCADLEVLERHEAEIIDMEVLDDGAKDSIRRRYSLTTRPPIRESRRPS